MRRHIQLALDGVRRMLRLRVPISIVLTLSTCVSLCARVVGVSMPDGVLVDLEYKDKLNFGLSHYFPHFPTFH